ARAAGRAVGGGGTGPAERQPARQLWDPGPRCGWIARDLHRAVPACGLGPPGRQLPTILRAGLSGAARGSRPVAVVIADHHRVFWAHRLAADAGEHDHPRRERPHLRLAHLPAGSQPVVAAAGPGRPLHRHPDRVRRDDLGDIPQRLRDLLAGASRWRRRGRPRRLVAAPALASTDLPVGAGQRLAYLL
ncbi:MAG: Rhomboid family protein, partial [uncultured Propionibacteriaceae bacterium]